MQQQQPVTLLKERCVAMFVFISYKFNRHFFWQSKLFFMRLLIMWFITQLVIAIV